MHRSMNPSKFGLWATIALSLLAFACDDSSSSTSTEMPTDNASLSGIYHATVDIKQEYLVFSSDSQVIFTVFVNNCMVSSSEAAWKLSGNNLLLTSRRSEHKSEFRTYSADQDSATICTTPLQSFWDSSTNDSLRNLLPFAWTNPPKSFQIVTTKINIAIDESGESHLDTTKTVWDFNREP